VLTVVYKNKNEEVRVRGEDKDKEEDKMADIMNVA